MAKCSECYKVLSTISALLTHFKLQHKYQCREEGCCRNYSNIKSFIQHFNKNHSNVTEIIPNTFNRINQGTENSLLKNEQTYDDNPTNSATCINYIFNKFKKIMKDEAIKFVSHLYSLSLLPRSHIQLIIDNLNMFLNSELVIFLEKCVIDTVKIKLWQSVVLKRNVFLILWLAYMQQKIIV